MRCFAGSFSLRTTNGSQSVTGVGFTPAALLFQVTKLTADGSAVDMCRGIGMAVSSTERWAMAANSLDAQANSNTDRRHDDSKCILLTNSSGAAQIAADLTSMDSDGFTLSVTADGTAYLVTYFAIGAVDADVAVVQAPAATGNASYTTPGFQPDCLIAFTIAFATAPPSTTTASNFSIGWATSATAEQSITGAASNAAATSDANAERDTGNIVNVNNAAGSTTVTQANLVSFDATGYTINWTVVTARAYVGFLALKGGRYASGSDAQKTSAGTQAKTGLGFQPVGLILCGINSTTDDSSVVHDRRSIGWASGTSARSCVWSGDRDNVPDTIADTDLDTASILKHMTEGTPTVDAEADLSSFDADGYTLNWTAPDATARAFGFLAFGSETPEVVALRSQLAVSQP